MRLSLTKRSEYGIAMLLFLAAHDGRERVTARELAEACGIPAGNVPTIMSNLARAGLLDCVPGRGGGCTLARDPGAITMLDIIEALEGRLELSHCLLDARRCDDHTPECALHMAWTSGRSAAINALARTSLAETVARQDAIESQQKRHRVRPTTRARRR